MPSHDRNLESDRCTCGCHRDENVNHITACCRTCSSCGEHIKFQCWEEHRVLCGVEPKLHDLLKTVTGNAPSKPQVTPGFYSALETRIVQLEQQVAALNAQRVSADEEPLLVKDARIGQMTPFELLHHLWTKAVGTPGYEKREWAALEGLILDAFGGPAFKGG